ncbi:MAG: hypothetical protein HY066_04615 [Betaproteobacteria bacterium]|nr:hypothetical protein [Betaproteobacteria bacterium]
MKLTVKRFWLGLALALTIAAMMTVGDPAREFQVAEPIVKTAPAKHSAPLRLSELKRPVMEVIETNPFAPKSWYLPPPPQPAQDIKPVPPPLPFSYKGKLEESDGRQFFYLAKGNESFVVSVGDTFGGSYKLESARADVLAIRYLPLSVVQTLRYGPEL